MSKKIKKTKPNQPDFKLLCDSRYAVIPINVQGKGMYPKNSLPNEVGTVCTGKRKIPYARH